MSQFYAIAAAGDAIAAKLPLMVADNSLRHWPSISGHFLPGLTVRRWRLVFARQRCDDETLSGTCLVFNHWESEA